MEKWLPFEIPERSHLEMLVQRGLEEALARARRSAGGAMVVSTPRPGEEAGAVQFWGVPCACLPTMSVMRAGSGEFHVECRVSIHEEAALMPRHFWRSVGGAGFDGPLGCEGGAGREGLEASRPAELGRAHAAASFQQRPGEGFCEDLLRCALRDAARLPKLEKTCKAERSRRDAIMEAEQIQAALSGAQTDPSGARRL